MTERCDRVAPRLLVGAPEEPLLKAEVQYICSMMANSTGVELGQEKEYVVQARLSMLARALGLSGAKELLARLVQPSMHRELAAKIVDALLTKETSFFRHPATFEALKYHVIPRLLASPSCTGPLRIWSAACSTGQEPYSILMALADSGLCQGAGLLDLVASDISPAALSQAEQGVYSQIEISRGLPIGHVIRHFRQDGCKWYMSPELKRSVRFLRQDLLSDTLPSRVYHVVFCRNVSIYFSDSSKERLFRRMERALVPGGYLFAGASETPTRFCPNLRQEQWKNVIFYRARES